MVGGEVKVATVEVESVDNMATLPVSRSHGGNDSANEKNNSANKEMEIKYVQAKPDKRYQSVHVSSSYYRIVFIFFCLYICI